MTLLCVLALSNTITLSVRTVVQVINTAEVYILLMLIIIYRVYHSFLFVIFYETACRKIAQDSPSVCLRPELLRQCWQVHQGMM